MKIFFYTVNLLATLLIISFGVSAQNNLPPIYEIKSDTALEQDLGNDFWQMLPDKNGSFTLAHVTSDSFTNRFYDRRFRPAHIDSITNTYWFRYRLKNETGHDIDISLDSKADTSDFYILQEGNKWKHFVSGYQLQWSKKDGLKDGNFIPVILLAGEMMQVYYRAYFSEKGVYKYFAITFDNTNKLVKQTLDVYEAGYMPDREYLLIFFAGFNFLAAIFNLFLFWIIRDKTYLFFSLFLFSLCFINNPLATEILRREHLMLSVLLTGLSAPLLFFFMWFMRYYYRTTQLFPRLNKLLFITGLLNLGSALIDVYYNRTSLRNKGSAWGPYIDVLSFIVLISSIIYFGIKQRDQRSKLFVLAVFPFFVVVIFSALIFIFFRHSSFTNQLFIFINLPLYSSLSWLILLFCWSLFKQYNSMQLQISADQLEKERFAKEKETERALLIEQQNTELEKKVTIRTGELNKSLEELKSTQSQLIQSEKMASLGELTAGIAHEIQNPLNFVNNFSDVNKELLEELKDEADKGNIDEVKAIANDVIDNEEKINHHGKRADAIVKGMLQHSRKNTGIKEPTGINALCDEYLRLSYHGLRAKDKNFNADFKTDFDENIGKINIVRQDIGRVLLNLYNNAFYATSEKKKLSSANGGYQPTASVKTRRINDKVEIIVSDNGNGIPQNIFDKIFQPFFTTKPTGEGTGLGLSLSYDIIKAHGGEIKVESKEGEGTEFIIYIPAS